MFLLDLDALGVHEILALGLLAATQDTDSLLEVSTARIVLFMVALCSSAAR